MNITNIRNPRYSSASNGTIDVTLELDGETVDFTASPNDSTDHGLDIYERAVTGEFGTVAAYVAPATLVPAKVSAAQGRITLLGAGLLDTVEALIASSTDRPLKIWYQYATEWERSNTYVNSLANTLGLNTAQVDALFISASQIN